MLFSLVALDVARHLAVPATVIDLVAAGGAEQRENGVLDVDILLVPLPILAAVRAVLGLAIAACLGLAAGVGPGTKVFAISIV